MVLVCAAQVEVADLLGDTDRILSQARARVRALSEEYYTVTNKEGDAHRPITRPEPIPATLDAMLAMREATFAALLVRAWTQLCCTGCDCVSVG